MKAYHPKVAALLWLALMLTIAGFGWHSLTKDWLETGFLALLPNAEQQPEIAKVIHQHNAQRDRKVIWLVAGGTPDDANEQARFVAQRLQQNQLFSSVILEVSQQTYLSHYKTLFPYRYQLLDAETRKQISEKPKEFLANNLATLYSPMGQLAAADMEHDPLLLLSRYFKAQNPIKLKLDQGMVLLNDGHKFYALIQSELVDSHLQLDKLENLFNFYNNLKTIVNDRGGGLLATGMPLFTAQGADSAKQEISTIGVGSSIGIVILMLLTFRSARPLLLSFVAIGSGLVVALVVSSLVFGKVHIITLVFGASLIGVADDYALHFVCDSFEAKNWQPRRALFYIFPGLLIGLLTNLMSYAGLVLSPFPGLQQVALFSAVGLLVAWLTVVLLFPLLLTGFNSTHQPVILKLANIWQQHWPRGLLKNRRWLLPLLVVFIVGGLWQLKPNDDVRVLQSASQELTEAADKIKQLLPVGQDNQFFLVSGKNLDDWYRNEQALLARLPPLVQQHQLASFQGLSDFWPNQSLQQQNYRILADGLYHSGLVKANMEELGFSEAAIETELKQFNDAKELTISLQDWLAAADEAKQSLWPGCDVNGCKSRVALSGIVDITSLSALQNLSGVAWVNQVGDLSSMFARYRMRASFLLVAAYLLVLGGLGFKLGWRNALTITSIPILAALVSLAMTGWCNQLFSLFNLFALLLVLGIGVDDAIFFFMAERSRQVQDSHALIAPGFVPDKRDTTALAVTLSALTTLLAFGLLAASSTEIVHAFGFTIATGILTALLCSPLIGYKKP